MPADLEKLKTELAKPTYAEKIKVGDHAGLAEALNALGAGLTVERGVVTRDTLIGDLSGIVADLVQRAGEEQAQGWLAIYDRLLAPKETFNMRSPVLRALLGQIRDTGYMTQAEYDDLLVEAATVAQAAGIVGPGEVVTIADIPEALRLEAE